jgi:ABC-type nitrate/sulfonate/bicarbonate transport system permease component
MYVIPLIVVLAIALLTIGWAGTPIFALIIFAVLFVGFLAYAGISRRADQKVDLHPARGAEKGPHEPSDSTLGR